MQTSAPRAQTPHSNAPVVAAPAAPGGVVGRADAAEVFRGFRAQRSELQNQLRQLENRRAEVAQSLQAPNLLATDRTGLEKRVLELDGRISDVEKQIASADADVARAAAVPGATVEPPREPRPGPPDEVYVLSGIFMVIVFLPLSVAFARRIWRRSAAVTVKLTNELSQRMDSLERAVEAVAVEVERVGEGQRFVTQVLAGDAPRAIGAGAAEPIPVQLREPASETRR
jgi:chromosome segregation ATPase